jgi:NAD(P)-dependent dehydrogenase (short-subunit alcohol dehydrogenase family)
VNNLYPGALSGIRALVTGSSRGIGAETATMLAAGGARVAINYRNKEARALRVVAAIQAEGGEAIALGGDLTDLDSVAAMFAIVQKEWDGLDLLVLNASGGMESGMGEDYAMKLNRDAQINVLDAALPLMASGSRVVFVTSHQAHFVATAETMPSYLPVALSKRAGEDALRDRVAELDDRGIGFVVVSGDMIEGTITATLLERAQPGAIESRREEAGKLYTVNEFAAEVAQAAIDPIPESHTRYVGDISGFVSAP